jgi:hypothetical protein
MLGNSARMPNESNKIKCDASLALASLDYERGASGVPFDQMIWPRAKRWPGA